jgi:RNA 2',3'-cyclic 3'-phosphodiesterase
MRVFVGVDPDDEIRERMAQFIAEMRVLAPGVRWVTPESLHVTLKFIGEKPDKTVREIEASLGSVSADNFDLSFRGCGFFPTAKSARVFWIGTEAPPTLERLAAQIDEALAGIGIPKETRAFSPHSTLARAGSGAPARNKRDKPNQQFAALQQKLAQLPSPDFGTMAAREFFLYRSQLSGRGPLYTKIADFSLRSAEE